MTELLSIFMLEFFIPASYAIFLHQQFIFFFVFRLCLLSVSFFFLYSVCTYTLAGYFFCVCLQSSTTMLIDFVIKSVPNSHVIKQHGWKTCAFKLCFWSLQNEYLIIFLSLWNPITSPSLSLFQLVSNIIKKRMQNTMQDNSWPIFHRIMGKASCINMKETPTLLSKSIL